MTHAKVYSAIDLLDSIFEFTEMTPNTKDWNERALRSNPPRLIRFRQVIALITAFIEDELTLPEKAKILLVEKNEKYIQDFLAGVFIRNSAIENHTEVVALMKKVVQEKEININTERAFNIMELVMVYQKLINYKRQLRKLLTFNSGVLEAGFISSRFSIYLTESISENMRGKYEELDNALELLINPKRRLFTEDELKRNYNFPQEHLGTIDADFY